MPHGHGARDAPSEGTRGGASRHDASDTGGARLLIALALNVGITVAQVIGGLLANSLALLSDAAHNASDAASLGISYGARRLSRRPADAQLTFGYARAETVGAMVNLTTLVVIALYLLAQGIQRLSEPPDVPGATLLIVGAIAFVEDLLSVWVLRREMARSLNVRSAVLHLIGDTASTVAVMLSGALILWRGVTWVDPALTIAISLFLLYQGVKELRKAIRVLMDATPPGFEVDRLVAAARAVEGVRDLRHVHVWRLDEHRTALEAHVSVAVRDVRDAERIRSHLKRRFEDGFDIAHSTLELEWETGSEQAPGRDAAIATDDDGG